MAKGAYSKGQYGGGAAARTKEKILSPDTPSKPVTDWNKPPNPVHKGK